jgi:hypothetical protein
MALTPEQERDVKHQDLINIINSLIARIDDLEDRVEALET